MTAATKTERVLRRLEGHLSDWMEDTDGEPFLDEQDEPLQGEQYLADVKVLRNAALPEETQDGLMVVILDGDPGEPERTWGGFTEVTYTHTVELQLFAQHKNAATRDALMAQLLADIGDALEAAPTLDGEIEYMEYAQPGPSTEPVIGGEDIKHATVLLTLEYQAPSALG